MRIKINTNNIAKKLSAISCQLSAFRKKLSAISCQLSAFRKKLPAVSCQLSAFRKKLPAVSCQLSAFKKLTANSYKLTAILSSFRKLTANSYKLKAILSASRKLTATKGFTLVELLVTLSLFVVLTTIVLFSQQKFNGSILLTNLAYDVALTVRQAQTYGINVRETSGGSFEKAYGVHFEITSDAEKKKFLLFSDDNKNDKYGGGDSVVNKYSIKRGNYISDICITSSGTEECEIKKLDITFLRPNPDALFRATKKDNNDANNITEAKIILSSANGDNRNVLVNSTGQISIGRGE